MKGIGLTAVFALLGGLVLLFILAPITGLFLQTSPVQFFETVNDREVTGSIFLTLGVSFLTTLACSALAIPLAYVLARKSFKGKVIVESIVDLPVVIPHSAAGIALLGLVSRDTWLGQAASAIGLDFVGNPLGIAVAMAFVSVPFLIRSARDGFSGVPVRLEQAARTLGASGWRTFSSVSLPLAKRSILTGLVMMFSRGLSEFGAVVIIAYHPMVTPVLIYERFGAFGISYARPIAAVFVLVCLVFFILLRILANKKSYDPSEQPRQ